MWRQGRIESYDSEHLKARDRLFSVCRIGYGRGLNLILIYLRTPFDSPRSAPGLYISSEDGGCDAVEAQSPTLGAGRN